MKLPSGTKVEHKLKRTNSVAYKILGRPTHTLWITKEKGKKLKGIATRIIPETTPILSSSSQNQKHLGNPESESKIKVAHHAQGPTIRLSTGFSAETTKPGC